MYEAFPRSDYYGSSVTVPDIQKLNFIAFRHSGLGNPRLALWQHSFDRLSAVFIGLAQEGAKVKAEEN